MFPIKSTREAVECIVCCRQRERQYSYKKVYSSPVKVPRSPSSSLIHDRDFLNPQTIVITDKGNGSRMKICAWTFDIVDHFDLKRQTAVITIDIFDRFMATRGNVVTPDFALLSALASLFIATKTNEQRKLRSQSLARFTRSQFSSYDIEEMESEILNGLSWLVHPPTAASFLFPLTSFFPKEELCDSMKHLIFEKSQYITELAVFDTFFIDQPASLIAVAAMLITLHEEVRHLRVSHSCRNEFIHLVEKVLKCSKSPSFRVIQEKLVLLVREQKQEEYQRNEIKRSRYHS